MHSHPPLTMHVCMHSAPGPVESYRSNSKKEQLILSYAENFQRQFRQLYGDRKSLFLKPVNEYGVEVCVCITHLIMLTLIPVANDCLLASFYATPSPTSIACRHRRLGGYTKQWVGPSVALTICLFISLPEVHLFHTEAHLPPLQGTL